MTAVVAALREEIERLERLGDARWAVDHGAWPDGKPITKAEKSSAEQFLRRDRAGRARAAI